MFDAGSLVSLPSLAVVPWKLALVSISPFETAMYGTDTTSEIFVGDILEASHLHKAGERLLIRESPYALHQVLIACLIICNDPACVHKSEASKMLTYTVSQPSAAPREASLMWMRMKQGPHLPI